MKNYILENETLTVTVIPEMGGKTISIWEKAKKFQLLAQQRLKSMKTRGTMFADCSAFGFDDAFPCIDPESVLLDGREVNYPDHGEIWSASMQVKYWDAERNELQLYYESPLLHYSYEKKITLEKHKVNYSYQITNHGSSAFPCIWAFHCLVRYEEDMKICFPNGTNTFVNVLESSTLGGKDTEYHVMERNGSLRSAETLYQFDRVPSRNSHSMEKYYAKDPVREGLCGYDYPSQGISCKITYDKNKLPYLGFFVTAGGFMGDYNLALEPCDGFYDSVGNALNRGRCIMLEPKESREFEIEITLT